MPRLQARDWPVDQIRQWIEVDLLTHAEVGKRLDCAHQTVSKLCRKHGIRTQRNGPRSGPNHPDWKGGRHIDKDGYVPVWCEDHPNRRKYCRYMFEHRLVMEAHLGRLLNPEEVVHHRNGDKKDNRIENLELFESNAAHLRETLAGQCPRWTPEGRRRTLEAVRRGNRNHPNKARDGRRSRQASGHSTRQSDSNDREP